MILNDKVTKITFIASLTGHILFLVVPLSFFHLSSSSIENPKDTVVEVEIETRLPEIKKIGPEKKLIEIKNEPEPELKEIALENSKTVEVHDLSYEAMLRYQDIVKQRIERKKEYPLWARNQGIKGKVHIRFGILSDGQLDKVEMIRTSGYEILDKSAVDAVRRANPFPVLPKELNTQCVQIGVTLVYILEQ